MQFSAMKTFCLTIFPCQPNSIPRLKKNTLSMLHVWTTPCLSSWQSLGVLSMDCKVFESSALLWADCAWAGPHLAVLQMGKSGAGTVPYHIYWFTTVYWVPEYQILSFILELGAIEGECVEQSCDTSMCRRKMDIPGFQYSDAVCKTEL